MPDELIELAAAATVDLVVRKAAKRRRWVRILNTIGSMLFVAFLAGVVYITAKYS